MALTHSSFEQAQCSSLFGPQVVPSGPSESTILVHSALPVEPCRSWDDAPIMEHLHRVNEHSVSLWILASKTHNGLCAV